MASPAQFWDGFVYLVVGCVLSLILVLFTGIAVDGTIGAMESIDILDTEGEWRDSSATDIYWWQSYAYVVAISPAILGVIAMILSAVASEKVEKEDNYRSSQFSEEIDI